MNIKATPMIQQYLSIKREHPDALLLYRMGDFYEMFFEDARTASRVLEITLTSRNKNDEASVPMCGVPYRAVQGYIARLIENGFKVALCDQVEDPARAKGLVRREVVRVITPGMIFENEYLDAKSNNFILALCAEACVFGLSYLDVSTGDFRLTESGSQTAILDEFLRVSPAEVILPETMKTDPAMDAVVRTVSRRTVTVLEDSVFDLKSSRERLIAHFKTLSLEGFGCERHRPGVAAAGALLHYIGDSQKQPVSSLRGIETYTLSDYMTLDALTCRNLELTGNLITGKRPGSLISVLDRTVTAMGGRLLKHWLLYPLLKRADIEKRLEAVSEAVANLSVTEEIRELLQSVSDMERLGARIVMGHANARDLLALKRSLAVLPVIQRQVIRLTSALFEWTAEVSPLTDLADLLGRAIREDAPLTVTEGGIIQTGFNAELDDLIRITRDGKGWLARLEAEEKAATGINSLKVRFNKVFGYYLEVPRSHADKAPPHYVRKQTLVNAERYITEALKEFEEKVLTAEERRADLEYRIFNEIREEIQRRHELIREAAHFMGTLDCLLSLAHVAARNDFRKPEIDPAGRLAITDGRHPVIETMISGERFIPNSVYMDNRDSQMLIITGPNMAGKSTVLRQVALVSILAQMGSFVPAGSASVCLIDRIFTRVGALDNLSQGQSTFMVEMQETANILNNATPDSLVILDEIGRGTSTYDGLSIAWAVAEYLHDLKGKGVKTLFATHYHELTELVRTRPRAKNYSVAVKEIGDRILFLRKLVEGGTSRSYGIQVAQLAGVPLQVIHRAKEILEEIGGAAPVRRPPPEGVRDKRSRYASRPIQMGLFRDPERSLADMIQNLDLTKMTPLDAMNYLNELREKTKFH